MIIFSLQFLQQQKKKQEEELSALRKEAIGLQIMKSNYDQMVKANQNQSGQLENRVSDEVKFQVVCVVFIITYNFRFNYFLNFNTCNHLLYSFKLSWKTYSRLLTPWYQWLILENYQVVSLHG